jgi:multidrug transporter EmrE-like cation transporter
MSMPQIFTLSLVEIVGDFALKKFANEGGLTNLTVGIVGYIGVIVLLIISLQGSTVLLVNNAWDGMSTLIESAAAYFLLGERFKHNSQYVGVILITIGVYLLKVPWVKNKLFTTPQI